MVACSISIVGGVAAIPSDAIFIAVNQIHRPNATHAELQPLFHRRLPLQIGRIGDKADPLIERAPLLAGMEPHLAQLTRSGEGCNGIEQRRGDPLLAPLRPRIHVEQVPLHSRQIAGIGRPFK